MKRCLWCFREYEGEYGVCPHCGRQEIKDPIEPIHLRPSTVLAGRYMLGQAIGSGGFGIVYRAWDMKLETIVAVKEFYVSRLVTRAEGLRNLIVSAKHTEEYEYRKERFLAEARNMARFGSHRSIPNVFEFFEENNTAYIVMELLEGEPLNAYLASRPGRRIDRDFAIMITNEVGEALSSLHKQNIIHRDVAPDNIYICSGKEIRIKLMDLGAAKLTDATDDVVDNIMKPGYSPAEQYDSTGEIGPSSDVYALGATLYVMLTGIKPDESTNRKTKDELRAPHEIDPEIPENLSYAIMKAMAIERHMRYRSVAEFLSAINGERKVIPLHKEKRRRRMRRILTIAACMLILAVCGVLVYGAYKGAKDEQTLQAAEIEVWFSVAEGSSEQRAMEAVAADFEEKFDQVEVVLVPIPEHEYAQRLAQAAEDGKLPALFESSGIDDAVLEDAVSLDAVIDSEQFRNAMFLGKYYDDYYRDDRRMPLGIEVPMAYVITGGPVCIDYRGGSFTSVADLGEGTAIAYDDRYAQLLDESFPAGDYRGRGEFLNNAENSAAVLLSSSMILNEVRTTLTSYEKSYVYYAADRIGCGFVYEWSIGNVDKNEKRAAERLLSWMLGNVYQSYLMISECSDGQIPLNPAAFETRTSSKYYAELSGIHGRFVFDRKDKK